MEPNIFTGAAKALLALESAPASDLLPALRRVLAEEFDAFDVHLHLVDYRLATLQSVEQASSGPVSSYAVEGTEAGRVFASQQHAVQPGDQGVTVILPVTVRSDRLGVLSIRLRERPTAETLEAMEMIGTAIGHAITVANRHTDIFETAARVQRLSVAAEIQWQILPGRGCAAPDFDLAGQLEPAYHIAGDAFDWSVSTDHISVSVHEGTGSGTAAAQVTNLAVLALRNARRGGLDLADQARMADEALHSIYGGDRYIETLLLRFDRRSGAATAIDAGSPLFLRQRDHDIDQVHFQRQLPLGAVAGTEYREQRFDAKPGDRFIVVSDGVHHDHRQDQPHGFSRYQLISLLRSSRHVSPAECVRQVTRQVLVQHPNQDLPDDAVTVVMDWQPQR